MLGYECANSRMTIVVGADHFIDTVDEVETVVREDEDLTKMVFRVEAHQGNTIRLVKAVAYHSSRGVPVRELSDRCDRILDRATAHDVEHYHREQREWYDAFWAASDVQVSAAEGHPESDRAAIQQAIRFNLFSIAQANWRQIHALGGA